MIIILKRFYVGNKTEGNNGKTICKVAMIPLIRKLENDKEAGDKAEFHDFLIALCTQSERYLNHTIRRR